MPLHPNPETPATAAEIQTAVQVLDNDFDSQQTWAGPNWQPRPGSVQGWSWRLETFRRRATRQILGHRVYIKAVYGSQLVWTTADLPGDRTVALETIEANYPFYRCAWNLSDAELRRSATAGVRL